MSDDPKADAQCAFWIRPRVGSRWRHYKGGTYRITATSLHEETLERLITYRSEVYGSFWTRTHANWLERVDVDGRSVPRFEAITPSPAPDPTPAYELAILWCAVECNGCQARFEDGNLVTFARIRERSAAFAYCLPCATIRLREHDAKARAEDADNRERYRLERENEAAEADE